MTWLVEWTEWNEEAHQNQISSDVYSTWEDTVRIFMDCIQDNLCVAAKVTCFLGDTPYTDDPVVLEYRL